MGLVSMLNMFMKQMQLGQDTSIECHELLMWLAGHRSNNASQAISEYALSINTKEEAHGNSHKKVIASHMAIMNGILGLSVNIKLLCQTWWG
jgi:hypothetical protein